MFTACDRRPYSLVTNLYQETLEAFLPLLARFYNCTAFDLELCNALFKFTDAVKPYCELYNLFYFFMKKLSPSHAHCNGAHARASLLFEERPKAYPCMCGQWAHVFSGLCWWSPANCLCSSVISLCSLIPCKGSLVMCLCSIMPLCSQVLCLCSPVMHVSALCCHLSLIFFYVAICSVVTSYLHV